MMIALKFLCDFLISIQSIIMEFSKIFENIARKRNNREGCSREAVQVTTLLGTALMPCLGWPVVGYWFHITSISIF
jgi:hypothetical protein